ncbi:cupin domain-containing protein [Halomarina halobia]|uniref:Cupin domain-containing protein n=1 Tax=Halomarina halobia TaxID=3033386 RepID=A0ABD6AD87_9EURY|nr:cupin domain-containing protein [Halomarina sp. PSR21]
MTSVERLDDLEGRPHANVFPGEEPTTIRLALAAGERVEPHRHPDRQVVLFLVEGRLALRVGDERRELEAGDVARFDGDADISPRALIDSVALVVFAPRADGE